MPINQHPFSTSAIAIIAVCLLFIQCGGFREEVPLPEAALTYASPAPRPLKFFNPVTIEWQTRPPDSIRPMPVRRFNIVQLPAKPFDIGEPLPLKAPLVEKPFDWNSIPDTTFSLDRLPKHPLKFKTRLLGAPKWVTAGLPALVAGASRGVLEAGLAMGLPGPARCFLQDRNGQLWIGTTRGVCRYDGQNLTIYSEDQGLSVSNVTSLLEDNTGNMWIGTFSGDVFKMELQNGLISQLTDTIARDVVWSMSRDAQGRIWAARQNVGVLVMNESDKTLQMVNASAGLIDNGCVRVYHDEDNMAWISAGDGVNAINLKTGKLKRIQAKHGISSRFLVGITKDKKGRLWLGGDGGTDLIDLRKGSIKSLRTGQELEANDFLGELLQDEAGNTWIGGALGKLYVFNEEAGTLEALKVPGNDRGVQYNIVPGAKGQVWVGSTGGGAVVVNYKDARPANLTTADGLGHNSVWSIKQDANGLLWIGTRGGIDVYDPATKTIRHIGTAQGLLNEVNSQMIIDSKGRVWAGGNNLGFSIINSKDGTIHHLGREQGLYGLGNWSEVFEDSKGQMWIGADNGDLMMVDPETRLVKRISNAPEFNGRRIVTLREDDQQQIWVGIRGGGVSVINKERTTIRNLNTASQLISNEVFAFLQDKQGSMWVGTQRGIDIANLQDSTLTSITTNEGLANNEIWTLDKFGSDIYVGTSLGLSILTPDTASGLPPKWKSRTYGKAQGLTFTDFANNSSFVTNTGQLWAGVENAILTVIDAPSSDTTTYKTFVTGIRIMDEVHPFYDRNALQNAIANTDTLWKTDPDSFYKSKQLPPDTSYLARNNISWNRLSGPYQMPEGLKLPYHQNYLSFTFSGNYLSNPDKVKYRYILEGIDKNWSPVSAEGLSENYRDLPPGNYAFKVVSAGMNGVWSEPAVFRFTISPPWWKTWWAYLLYTLLFASLVGAYVRYRSLSLKRHNQELEEKVISRTNELRKSLHDLRETQNQLIQSEKMASLGELTAGIAHEIQNPLNFVNNFSDISVELAEELRQELNTLNIEVHQKESMQGILDDLVQNQQKINFHGKRADAIVKGMLQHSRSSSGVKEPTDINALADEYLRLAYHGLRAKDKSFNAKMVKELDETIPPIQAVPQDLGRVILNLITNAFYAVTEKKKQQIAGYEPTVWVSTKKTGNTIEVSITDNGMGIPDRVRDKIFQPFFTTKPVGQGTGLGLSMSYEIVTKAHQGELLVKTKEGEGTTFTIKLPL